MPVSEKDIYRSAKAFVEKHGDDALSEAIMKIVEHEAKDDFEGKDYWNQIAYAVGLMQMPHWELNEMAGNGATIIKRCY